MTTGLDPIATTAATADTAHKRHAITAIGGNRSMDVVFDGGQKYDSPGTY